MSDSSALLSLALAEETSFATLPTNQYYSLYHEQLVHSQLGFACGSGSTTSRLAVMVINKQHDIYKMKDELDNAHR